MGHMLPAERHYPWAACYHFTGSSSSPDEDRLLKHLFDADSQPHNLMTTPITDINDTISVQVGIGVRKFVALVRPDLHESLSLANTTFVELI